MERLNTESPEVITMLFSGGDNIHEKLSNIFLRNTQIIEKAKKELRDAVDVVDQALRNATGQGLQDQCTN